MEFEAVESASKVLQLSPLSWRGARTHFRPWFHGFDPTAESAPSFIPREERGFPVTACFPGLRREYLPLLPQIGRTLGAYIETPRTAASIVAKAARLPSISGPKIGPIICLHVGSLEKECVASGEMCLSPPCSEEVFNLEALYMHKSEV